MMDRKPTLRVAADAGRRCVWRWPRTSIASKLILGFGGLTIVLFALAAGGFAILAKVTATSASLLAAEAPQLELLDRMRGDVVEQEHYARRAALVGSAEALRASREEVAEFRALLEKLAALPESAWIPARQIGEAHERFSTALELPGWPSDERVRERVDAAHQQLAATLERVAVQARGNQQRKTGRISQLGERAFALMVVACAAALVLGAGTTYLLTRSIARPILRLKDATARIAAGNFDEVPAVRRGDELGDLAQAFAEMAWRLKQLEMLSLDANPLTRLPGNRAIETEVAARLERGAPFVFCLADLDNFKAFNDHYGYVRGSELIADTARLVRRTVADHGGAGDFVGHIGGDDFVFVTGPERFRDLCRRVIAGFDALAGTHYDPADLRRGYLLTKNRQGREERYPIITISIAAVDSSRHAIKSALQIGEIAADLKEYAKSLGGSVYVVDKRRQES